MNTFHHIMNERCFSYIRYESGDVYIVNLLMKNIGIFVVFIATVFFINQINLGKVNLSRFIKSFECSGI